MSLPYHRAHDVTGDRFGSLVARHRAGKSGRNVVWACLCDCGAWREVRLDNMRSGNTTSCGKCK